MPQHNLILLNTARTHYKKKSGRNFFLFFKSHHNTLSKAQLCNVVAHSFPGFCRLRMHTKGGSPVAFVEYQDVRVAAQAMATLQGSFLLSSDRGAIRIEYAKSKMAAEVGVTNPCWIEVGPHLAQPTINHQTFVLPTSHHHFLSKSCSK